MTWLETKLKQNKDVANGLTPVEPIGNLEYTVIGTPDVLTLATFIVKEDIRVGKFSLKEYLYNMKSAEFNELLSNKVVWGKLLKAMPKVIPTDKGSFIYGRQLFIQSSLTPDQLLEYAILYITGIHYRIANIIHHKQTIDYELMHDDSNGLASMVAKIANDNNITFLEAAQRTGIDFIEYKEEYILSRSENNYTLWNKSSECFEDNLTLTKQQVIKFYERELLGSMNLKEEIPYDIIGD